MGIYVIRGASDPISRLNSNIHTNIIYNCCSTEVTIVTTTVGRPGSISPS